MYLKAWIVGLMLVALAECTTFTGYSIDLPDTPAPVLLAAVSQPSEPAELHQIVDGAALAHGVPAGLVRAQIDVQENCTWDARAEHWNENGTVDRGLMQINSLCWPEFAARAGVIDGDPFNPVDNVEVGIARLAYLHGRMGNWFDTLMAYKFGEQGARSPLPDYCYDYARTIIAEWEGQSA